MEDLLFRVYSPMRQLYAGFRRWDHAFRFCDERIKTAKAAGVSENWFVINRSDRVLYAPAQNINLFCWRPIESKRTSTLLLLREIMTKVPD